MTDNPARAWHAIHPSPYDDHCGVCVLGDDPTPPRVRSGRLAALCLLAAVGIALAALVSR